MMHRQQQQHRPLASFASLSTMFPDYAPPKYKPAVPVVPVVPSSPSLEKSEVVADDSVVAATIAADVPAVPIKKQKIKISIKITLVSKKTSESTSTSVVAPTVAPSPTKKIKITIKKQPKEEQQQPQQQQEYYQKRHFDIAPPSSMFFKPYSDYIAPPPKCCCFFIDNLHCFLRSTDNACIDTVTKKVLGFWNCEIGTNSKLLHEVCEEKEKKDFFCNSHEDDDNDDNDDNDDIKMRTEMRKKSDANRARITGQPIALLRQKIAIKYGMKIRSVPTK
jgi:ribosomal protein S10